MRFKKTIATIGYAIVFILLILDAKSTILAGTEGIQICIQTVIPSLFPFLVICPLLTNRLSIKDSFIGVCITRLCRLPRGSENLFLMGLLGGYPIGAQVIEQACQDHTLTIPDGKRMLGFCNNAGPAFILGMSAALFQSAYIPLILWGIQILSTFLVAQALPYGRPVNCDIARRTPLTLTKAMHAALRNMAGICGWVVAFRVLLAILTRWILWFFPQTLQVIIAGTLELSNGCVALSQIPNEALRFVICSGFLSFGGICVWMQTMSVSPLLQGGWFCAGRCLHAAYSLFLAYIGQRFLFPDSSVKISYPIVLLWLVIICTPFFYKKSIAFPHKLLYNKKKSVIEVDYAVSKKNSA